MKHIAVLETIGSITKVERLVPIEKNVLPGLIVLRNTNPFPGYIYSSNPKEHPEIKWASIFILLQYKYAPEKIIKLSSQIKRHLQIDCNAVYGEIKNSSSTIPCIRIKNLKYLSSIPKLQEFIFNYGFKQVRGQAQEYDPKIKVYKSFKLLEIAESIYRDYYEREKFYVKVPIALEWEQFIRLNTRVKSLLPKNSFDAALGEIIRYNGHESVIRIFDRDKSLERAHQLCEIFNRELKNELIFY